MLFSMNSTYVQTHSHTHFQMLTICRLTDSLPFSLANPFTLFAHCRCTITAGCLWHVAPLHLAALHVCMTHAFLICTYVAPPPRTHTLTAIVRANSPPSSCLAESFQLWARLGVELQQAALSRTIRVSSINERKKCHF